MVIDKSKRRWLVVVAIECRRRSFYSDALG
jgi:hypothetical protein